MAGSGCSSCGKGQETTIERRQLLDLADKISEIIPVEATSNDIRILLQLQESQLDKALLQLLSERISAIMPEKFTMGDVRAMTPLVTQLVSMKPKAT